MRPFKWGFVSVSPPPHTHTQAGAYSHLTRRFVSLSLQRGRGFASSFHVDVPETAWLFAQWLPDKRLWQSVKSRPRFVFPCPHPSLPGKEGQGERGEGEAGKLIFTGRTRFSQQDWETGEEELLWWEDKVDADPPATSDLRAPVYSTDFVQDNKRRRGLIRVRACGRTSPLGVRRHAARRQTVQETLFLHFQMQYHCFRFFYFFCVLSVSGTLNFVRKDCVQRIRWFSPNLSFFMITLKVGLFTTRRARAVFGLHV